MAFQLYYERHLRLMYKKVNPLNSDGVQGEHLDRKCPKAEVAWRSASDVLVPVFTATVTIIFPFLPLHILSGLIGEFITAAVKKAELDELQAALGYRLARADLDRLAGTLRP